MVKSTQVCRMCRRELPKESYHPAYRKDGRPNGREVRCIKCQDRIGTVVEALERARRDMTTNDKGCWLYAGALLPNGYANFSHGGRVDLLHRHSYRWHNGEIPGALFVLHRCNVKHCFNPAHLYLGDNSRNITDAYRDGLISRKGEDDPRRRLNGAQVLDIRASELPAAVLAEIYGVTRSTIYFILNRKTWTHI